MQRLNHGFTLTEALIVLVIVSILAAIAYPAYRESAFKTRRKDALTELLRGAQDMERCFSRQHAYNNAACSGLFPRTSPEGHYQITLVAGNLGATTYTLMARPPAGGAQLNDVVQGTDCSGANGIRIDQTGARTPAVCW